MKPAIEVNDIAKSYTINHKNKASYNTIKDDFGKLFKHPFRKDATVDDEEIFWALKGVSFSVNPGEIFGIIGKNGSGKSTLLKILSRIVEPTRGEAIMRGRVASLLEVGTGFNPELTGRENIFFNGSMLGMSKREISQKFNEIVEFSEVEKFIDTPVKFYSSGMYVRLAFSVAAHLEPDILILDEVLAVGDVNFQEKSRKKILSRMENGSTVLFVSHSTSALQQLCSRGVLLNNGTAEFVGYIDDVIEKYTGERPRKLGDYTVPVSRSGAQEIQIVKLLIVDQNNHPKKDFRYGEDLRFFIELNKTVNIRDVSFDLNFVSSSGNWAACINNSPAKIEYSTSKITLSVKDLKLAPGAYKINLSLHSNNKLQDFFPEIASLRIKSSSEIASGIEGVIRQEGIIITHGS